MDEDGKVSLLGLLIWDPANVTVALCGTAIIVRSGAFGVVSVFDSFESLGIPGDED